MDWLEYINYVIRSFFYSAKTSSPEYTEALNEHGVFSEL